METIDDSRLYFVRDRDKCETCRFYEQGLHQDPVHEGECKRHPPTVVPVTRPQYVGGRPPYATVHPHTYADSFCGEWAYKPEKETS